MIPQQPLPGATPSERVRVAWQRRNESDYIFDFWTALGWSILTLGIYGLYVIYQLFRRMRDHNIRRLELLESATAFAWDEAQRQGKGDELRPYFERIGIQTQTLRAMTADFRDPVIWLILAAVVGTIVVVIGFYFLDQDLVKHETAEGAIETDLAHIYGELGHKLSATQSPPKEPHNIAGRIVAAVFSCGIYLLWWYYNMFEEPNRHFEENWVWEDELAAVVQRLQ